jgi:hypothetical protein
MTRQIWQKSNTPAVGISLRRVFLCAQCMFLTMTGSRITFVVPIRA